MGYHLLIKTRFWEKTYTQIYSLSFEDLNKVVVEIKTTEKYTNSAILIWECHMQIVVSRSPNSFAKCAK